MEFPFPRQQFVNAIRRMIGDPSEDVGQPNLRVNVVDGHITRAWIEVLLAENHAGTLLALQDNFVKFAARASSGYDARFASKFGLFYAAGKLAVKHGVLPWATEWPAIAANRGYRNALLAAQGEAALTAKG